VPFWLKKVAFSSGQLALTDSETLDEVLECLVENFSIETQGAYDQQSLFEILIKAASSGDSIENTAKILKNVPTANDIRYHLDKIDNFELLETQINQALKSRIPFRIRKGCLKLAIDLNLIPYYGKPSEQELPYIYRSEAKSGTCSFYAYATLYVLAQGKRVSNDQIIRIFVKICDLKAVRNRRFSCHYCVCPSSR
jgi:hypothetical protein